MLGKFHWRLLGFEAFWAFLQICWRRGEKSYRHADQWWPEADLLNVQNFVKPYLGPIACIGINSKSVIALPAKDIEKEKILYNCLSLNLMLNGVA